jgi:hypothetical protein
MLHLCSDYVIRISDMDLFRRTVLALFLALLNLLDLQLNSLVYATFELRTVAELEEYLEPHEKRSQEDGLDKIVQQSRRPSFKFSMSNELRNPACNVNRASPRVGCRAIRRCEVIRIRGASDEYRDNHGACDRLHQDVQGRVEYSCGSADVEREIGHGKP